jgi:hypothetical protein
MKINPDVFLYRPLLIVTKHNKNKIIAPMLEKELGVECFLPEKFDTDSLGTFSGEIERKKDALSTLRDKCLLAMKMEGYDLAVATEGSFGNHPTVFFAPANDEFIILIDLKNNLEIVERVLSLETNFKMAEINHKESLNEFLKVVQFPSHGVIVKDTSSNWKFMEKGIQKKSQLNALFETFAKNQQSFFIETDMRANYNPTRMRVIKQACKKLVTKIKSACPSCKTPGFGVVRAEAGLKCHQCGMPTRSTSAHVYACKKCNFENKKAFPNGKTSEDPMYCDFCNP